MAAGEGTRLRPLSERWPKPVLPIDGRPVLATLLRELNFCDRVVVVTGHLAEQVEELVGDGSGFGLEVRTTRQPGVLGSADAVFTPGDVRRFAEAFTGAGAMSGRRDPPADPAHRAALKIVDGLVVEPVDRDPANKLGSAPLWALGAELVGYLDGLSGPPYELADAFKHAIADGLAIAGIEIGRTRDLTYPEDLIRENVPYLEL